MSSAPNPEINIKQSTTTEFGLADAFEAVKRKTMLDLNCHAIATVQSFDPVLQTITATVNYKKIYYTRESPTNETYIKQTYDYPLLQDVPVVFMQGGLSGLTFPVKAGDIALILFNDRAFDTWWDNGDTSQPVPSTRLHSLSDGIAIIGLSHSEDPISDFDMNGPTLYNKNASFRVGEDKFRIKNQTKDLKTILTVLVTTIAGLTVAGLPLDANTLANSITDIAELLE